MVSLTSQHGTTMKPSGHDTKYDASPASKVDHFTMSDCSNKVNTLETRQQTPHLSVIVDNKSDCSKASDRSKMSKISHLRLKMMKKPPSETKVKTASAVRNYFVPFMVVVASSVLLWAWLYLFQSRLFAAQALTALEHGQSEAALEMFRKSISCNPHNAPAHFYCGLILERNGKFPASLDYFSESARLAPGNPDVLDRQASVAIKLERYQLAADVYKKLFAVKSFVPAAQQLRDQACALEHLGKYNEALVQYVVSLKLDPNNPLATEGVARCQMAQGQYDKAVENLNKLIVADENDVSALLLRGWSYKNLGLKAMAHTDFDAAIKLAPRCAEAHLYKARFMDSIGDRNEALKELTMAVAVEPANKAAREERALYLLSLKQYEEALGDFAKLPAGNDNLYTQVSRARKAVALGMPNALILVNEIITAHPHYAAMYLERAECMAKRHNWIAAVAACNKALSIEPNSVAILLKRAQINASAGNTTEALNDFESVVARIQNGAGSSPSATASVPVTTVGGQKVGGDSEAVTGQNNFAVFVGQTAVAAYIGLGNQQMQLSRFGSALRSFRKATQIQPRNAEAIAGIKTASDLLLSAARTNRENNLKVAGKTAEEISETELAQIAQADFSSLLEKSYVSLKSHRVSFAIRALRRAIQLDSTSVLARRYLATALLADRRPQEADEQFALLEQLGESRNAGDCLKLAACYLEANSPKRAAEILSEHVERHTNDVNAIVLLSRAYASSGDTQRALDVCSKAMANVSRRDHAKLQKEIASLKNTTSDDPDAYEKEAHDVAAMDFRS